MDVSDQWEGPGWWLASDGRWYAPHLNPNPAAVPAIRGVVTHQLPEAVRTSAPAPTQLPSTFSITSQSPGSRRKSHSRRRLTYVVIGAVAIAAVVGGLLVAVSAKSISWDPRVLGIVHFVEQQRGLTFKQPVKVEFLGDDQFKKQVSIPQPKSKSDRTAMAHALGEMRALGLVHGNVDLSASANTLVQADVVGLYVNAKKTVFVRGSVLTPYVRTTLAHELTHALQDQYFDLTQLENNVSNGGDNALTALVEGDAMRVQNAYQQNLSSADQSAYASEEALLGGQAGQTGNVPQILSDIFSFPYAFGPTFVDSLVSKGGNAAVDQAFRTPPVSEAEIVDPVAYPLSWRPTHVAAPAIGNDHRIDTPGPFGQFSLFEVLGSRLGYDAAWGAVQGWRGDNSVPYTDKARTCIAIDVAMADAASSGRLASAARQWAQGVPGAVVTQRGSEVDLRSCDPGPSAPAPPTITPSAFDILAARAAITDQIMTSAQVDAALGQCITDGVIAGVGPAGYSELTASTLSPTQQSQFQQLVGTSAANCRARGVS